MPFPSWLFTTEALCDLCSVQQGVFCATCVQAPCVLCWPLYYVKWNVSMVLHAAVVGCAGPRLAM